MRKIFLTKEKIYNNTLGQPFRILKYLKFFFFEYLFSKSFKIYYNKISAVNFFFNYH